MICALGAMQAQADSGGPMRFVHQAYRAPSDFARVTPAEETLIDVSRAPQRISQQIAAGRTFWISVEKTSRPTLAELDALLNPLAPVSEVIEEACAEALRRSRLKAAAFSRPATLKPYWIRYSKTTAASWSSGIPTAWVATLTTAGWA